MNPNGYAKVRPTDTGWKQIAEYVDNFNDRMRARGNHKYRASLPDQDEHGYIRDPLWCLLQYFDFSGGMGTQMPFDDIILEDET